MINFVESVRLVKFLKETMKITDTELICDKYDETLELPQEIKITKFNQQDKLGRFLDNAK